MLTSMKIYNPLLIKVTFLRKAYFDPGSIHQDLLDEAESKTDPAKLMRNEFREVVAAAKMLIIINSVIGLNNLGKYLVKWIQSETML